MVKLGWVKYRGIEGGTIPRKLETIFGQLRPGGGGAKDPFSSFHK